MKKSLLLSFAVLLMLASVGSVQGQQQAGDLELQFYGSYFSTVGTDFTFGSGTIGGKVGPYITDNIQVGIGPSLSITTTSVQTFNRTTFQVETESETKTTFGTSAFFVYSFLTSGGKFVPYCGAQWFKSDFNKPISEDKGSAGVNAGIKYFFAKKTALDISGNYLWNLNTESQGGVVLIAFGLSFLF